MRRPYCQWLGPSSARVSPVTYHYVVAVRYPSLCKLIDSRWILGSFASGGVDNRPPDFQFVLWDTNAKLNGLVAADMNTLISHVLESFSTNTGYSDGLFVLTTATDHKNSLNRSNIKKNFARALRLETIANSAGELLHSCATQHRLSQRTISAGWLAH